MTYFFMLLVFIMASYAADGNPDNGVEGGSLENKDVEGSISSIDEAISEDNADDSARSDTTEPGGNEKKEEPLILGKFKTNEEVHASYQELERKLHEISTENANLKKPAATQQETTEEWVELSPEQIATLQETDPEAHQWYLKEKEDRRVNALIDAKINPINEKIKPIDDLQNQKLAEQFYAGETAINMETKKVFGDKFESLDKQRQDKAFLQKVFPTFPKPIADSILFHNKNGSPEYARQLLLGQIEVYNLRQNSNKRSMSIPADVGSPGRNGKTSDKAGTLEEAGEMAAAELGIR